MEILSWIFFYLILPLALGVLGNFATPWVKSYFEKSSLTVKQRRIYALLKEYKWIKRLKENSQLFTFQLARLVSIQQLGGFVMSMIILVAVVSLQYIDFNVPLFPKDVDANYQKALFLSFTWIFVTALVLYAFISIFFDFMSMRNVTEFDKYKEKTIAKLKKLGGDPENLDKEEG